MEGLKQQIEKWLRLKAAMYNPWSGDTTNFRTVMVEIDQYSIVFIADMQGVAYYKDYTSNMAKWEDILSYLIKNRNILLVAPNPDVRELGRIVVEWDSKVS